MAEETKKMEQHPQQQIWGLPEEVMMNIFLELPAKSLLRLKCVCKSWYNLISDPYFIKLHLNRSIQDENNNLCALIQYCNTHHIYYLHQKHHHQSSRCITILDVDDQFEASSLSSSSSSPSIDLNEVTPLKSYGPFDSILGSCNGLILLGADENQAALWNPTTGEFMELPTFFDFDVVKRGCLFNNAFRLNIFGLGYDLINDDYKVIEIHHRFHRITKERECKVAVYSLRSDTWRLIMSIQGEDKCSYVMLRDMNTTGKYLNGAIHWLSYDLKKIVCFECGSEEWNEIEVPDHECQSNHPHLDLFRGRLCIVTLDTSSLEIYEMREYGVKESWSKISSISYTTLAVAVHNYWVPLQIREWKFLGVMKNCFLLGNDDEKQPTLYNPIDGSVAKLNITDTNVKKKKKLQQQLITPCLVSLETYMNCLVQLKSSQAR